MLRDVVSRLLQGEAAGNIDVKVSPRFSLVDLANDLSEYHSLPHRHVIKALSLCLNSKERIGRVPEDDVTAARIASHAAGLLCRSLSGLPLPLPHSADAASVEDVLAVLRTLTVNYSAPINDDTLLSVAAYTDSNTTWSTETIASMARDLLHCALKDEYRKHVFITSVVLEGFVRPVFSQSSSSRITSTGRKAHYANDDRDHPSQGIFAGDAEAVSWKGDQLHAITVFSLAVEQSDEQVIGKNWPLFTPVLLALIDDTDARFKAQGLAILQGFLARCPSSVLQDTGLGEIFEQSIFPSLMFLPTLTPEDESVQLLDTAYGAAIRLASAQFPEEKNRPRKNRLFVRLLREGIISGYWYASEHPRIVELLVRQASLVVQHLGTFTIPHVKDLLSMLAAIMTNPFFVSCPTCIETTSQSLSTMMLNCWPRISQPTHSGEVLRAVSVCWLNLKGEQESGSDSKALQSALAAVSSLAPIISTIFTSAKLSPQDHFYPLCDAEPRLLELFGNGEATIGVPSEGEISQEVAA